MCTDMGCAAAMESARGGGVKRHPATTARISATHATSRTMKRTIRWRGYSSPCSTAGVSRQRFTAARPKSAVTSTSFVDSSHP